MIIAPGGIVISLDCPFSLGLLESEEDETKKVAPDGVSLRMVDAGGYKRSVSFMTL
jgi:hypothetical protein